MSRSKILDTIHPTRQHHFVVSSVYGLNDSGQRDLMWSELDDICSRWNGPWLDWGRLEHH